MRRITLKYLESNNACADGIEYYKTLNTTDYREILEACIRDKEFDYALWLIERTLSYKNNLRLQVFIAEDVLPLFENEYPNDKRPRLAIDAKKAVIKYNSQINRVRLEIARDAAWDAAWDAARAAAWAAASDAASDAAWAAARAAAWDAARAAARAAASDAAWAAAWDAAWDAAMTKYIKYAIELGENK